jgi:hypothetical protein
LDVVRDALSFDSSSPSDPILHLFSPFSVSLFELLDGRDNWLIR